MAADAYLRAALPLAALNVIFMLVEFALNGLLVEAWHLGLVVAWASFYGLFNGLQVCRVCGV